MHLDTYSLLLIRPVPTLNVCLLLQATTSLKRYNLNAVVANLLHNRTEQVLLLHNSVPKKVSGDVSTHGVEFNSVVIETIVRPQGGAEIEGQIIERLAEMHNAYRA